jgi:UDP-3-O-[3-hydroxymyristoyl] glucosamine N-acyltransferase
MIRTQGKSKLVIVGYTQATITNEFHWWLSTEFSGPISIVEPKDLTIDNNTAYIVSVTKDAAERLAVIAQLHNSALVTFVHSSAVLHQHCQIGPGTFIGPYTGVYYNASIGLHCIVSPNSMISHNTVIGENTIVQPGTIVAGSCSIGNNCVLGLRSTVIDNIRISDNISIAAGALITKNLTEPGTYIGSPARKRLN